jgi:hypothetical protein
MTEHLRASASSTLQVRELTSRPKYQPELKSRPAWWGLYALLSEPELQVFRDRMSREET